jgi:hypothetical protein
MISDKIDETAYAKLEDDFRKQVQVDRLKYKCDDIVFLPLFIKPTHKVEYVFISMEPSLTKLWADPPRRSTAESQIEKGFRNFMPDRFEDTIVHYCATKYLCTGGQTYYITDMSKGATSLAIAKQNREERWVEWFPLLMKELDIIAKNDATIFTLGNGVFDFINLRKATNTPQKTVVLDDWRKSRFSTNVVPLLHYSRNNAPAIINFIRANETKYNNFEWQINKKDVVGFASTLLTNTRTPSNMKKYCLEKLKKQNFTDLLKKLIFVYKEGFEMFKEKIS